MNNSGQANGILGIFGAAIAAIFCIVILGMFFNALSCGPEKSKITDLEGKLNQQGVELQKAKDDANFYKTQYETLRDYNITKQDFVDLKAQVNDLNYQYTQINYQLFTLNQTIQQKYEIFSLSVALNFLLLPLTLFTLFDLAFLNLKYVNKTRVLMLSIATKIKQSIKIKKEEK